MGIKQLTQKALSNYPDLFGTVKRLRDQIRRLVFNLLSSNGFISNAYYFIADRSYLREQHAVAYGVAHHLKQNSRISVRYLLRRNVHRIEKGLIMRPRKPVFALEYVGETLSALSHYIRIAELTDSNKHLDDETVLWSLGVLSEYFSACQASDAIKAHNLRFNELCARVRYNNETELNLPSHPYPYKEVLSYANSISYDTYENFLIARRSVRWFQNKEIPRDDVDSCVKLAIQSPTACNRIPYRFIFIDDKNRLDAIASIPGGTKGFSKNIPFLAIVVGDLSAYFDERDRHCIYIDSSLATMSFILALQTKGLASCAINWPDVPDMEKRMRHELKLDGHERVIMLLAVGYPDPNGLVPSSKKLSIDCVRTYIAD